jgi:hypothetical protein
VLFARSLAASTCDVPVQFLVLLRAAGPQPQHLRRRVNTIAFNIHPVSKETDP